MATKETKAARAKRRPAKRTGQAAAGAPVAPQDNRIAPELLKRIENKIDTDSPKNHVWQGKGLLNTLEGEAGSGAKAASSGEKEVAIQIGFEKAGDYDAKLEIEKPTANPKDDWYDWINSIAASVNATLADDSQQVDPKRHAAWLEEHFSKDDIWLSQREHEQVERGWALDGGPVELVRKVAAMSRRVLERDGPARWRRFALTTVAATLRRMEERSDTPEEEIDVLLRALLPVRERLRPAVGTLLLAARARLERQANRSDGYYKTRGGLADLLSDTKDETGRRQRCYLYWEILRELQAMGEEAITAGVWASIVNTDANNLASTLDDLRLDAQSARSMKLAVMAGSAARQLGEDTPAGARAADGLTCFFPAGTPVVPEWAALLDDMGNVPATWKRSGNGRSSELDMWAVELAAAVARTGLLDQADDGARKVASALFNAGVTVARGAKSGNEWRNPRQCRVVLYGAGLLWALVHRTNDDFAGAMERNRGGSCAVNLMGALVELAPDGMARESLAVFVDALLGLRPALPVGDYLRIDEAAKRLKLARSGETADPLPGLRALVAVILEDEEWRAAWRVFAEKTGPASLCDLLVTTGARGHAGFVDAASRLARVLGDFEEQARNWPKGFVGIDLDDVLPDWRNDIARELQALLANPALPDRIEALASQLIPD